MGQNLKSWWNLSQYFSSVKETKKQARNEDEEEIASPTSKRLIELEDRALIVESKKGIENLYKGLKEGEKKIKELEKKLKSTEESKDKLNRNLRVLGLILEHKYNEEVAMKAQLEKEMTAEDGILLLHKLKVQNRKIKKLEYQNNKLKSQIDYTTPIMVEDSDAD